MNQGRAALSMVLTVELFDVDVDQVAAAASRR
ncbi:hypothetical protein IW248_000865 [Micromonospora ureilytica]|uniref:Uncharacterized protein n=1 Tax=Micromonospora ureilytica TaxID=709868 RepID=A0ABS0JBZ7_9ACTN|nr:hypothetical protein [Micromonospora ureilytica]